MMSSMSNEDKTDILLQRVLARAITTPYHEPSLIKEMRYNSTYAAGHRVITFYQPCIVFVLQGNKHSIVGDQEFNYGRGYTFMVGVDIPSASQFINVSAEKPFVAISFSLDRTIITKLFNQLGRDFYTQQMNGREGQIFYGASLTQTSSEVLDVLLRLTEIESQGNEHDCQILAPMLIMELYYYILKSVHGLHLFSLLYHKGNHGAIVKSIEYLCNHYKEDFDVNTLASNIACMQASTFFRHFKATTGLSPLQFKKRLRLVEAKRLLDARSMNVSSCAYEVGYESISQFSREFKQLFNVAPSHL